MCHVKIYFNIKIKYLISIYRASHWLRAVSVNRRFVWHGKLNFKFVSVPISAFVLKNNFMSFFFFDGHSAASRIGATRFDYDVVNMWDFYADRFFLETQSCCLDNKSDDFVLNPVFEVNSFQIQNCQLCNWTQNLSKMQYILPLQL